MVETAPMKLTPFLYLMVLMALIMGTIFVIHRHDVEGAWMQEASIRYEETFSPACLYTPDTNRDPITLRVDRAALRKEAEEGLELESIAKRIDPYFTYSEESVDAAACGTNGSNTVWINTPAENAQEHLKLSSRLFRLQMANDRLRRLLWPENIIITIDNIIGHLTVH